MKVSDLRYLVLPGYGDSGPGHWQTLWEAADARFSRVHQRDWENPKASEWVARLEAAVAQDSGPVILVAHSLACLLVAHWAATTTLGHGVKGALLVGVPDPASPVFPPSISGFDPLPRRRLPFPTLVVSSTDDPFASVEFTQNLARDWGAELVSAGARGHLNGASGLGDWPQGRAWLARLAAG